VRLPPWGIASRALSARLRITVVSWLGSTQSGRCISRQHRVDFDLLSQRRPKQSSRIDDQRIDVNFTGLQRLSASECQQSLGEIGAACARQIAVSKVTRRKVWRRAIRGLRVLPLSASAD